MQNFIIYLAIVGIMLQAGCSTSFSPKETTPPFGSSVQMAIRSQTVNPEAGGDAPVVGLDGKYAAKVAETYQSGPVAKESKDTSAQFGVVEDK